MSEKTDNPGAQDAAKPESVISAPDASDKKKSGGLVRAFIFIIVLIIIAVAGLAASGQLKSILESAKSSFSKADISSTRTGIPEPANDTVTEADTGHMVTTTEPEAPEPRQDIQTEFETPPEPVMPASQPATEPATVSSHEIQTLLATIDSLRSEMSRMEESQLTLRKGLNEQQQMNLQVRLRWITDPASRLPQIQLAWEEISLMVNLTATQRNSAEKMHTLARKSGRDLRNWQDALVKWADALSVTAHEDILPQPEHPWLAWVVGQFHLRQAPSIEARRLDGLRTRLLLTARQLSLESWPEQGVWQALHAELLLQVQAMQKQDQTLAIELGLPDNFEAIRADINLIRETASQWAQNGQGET